MAMGDIFMRQEGVQQGLDGRIAGAAIQEAGALGAAHILLGEALQLAQAAQLIEVERRQIDRFHMRHIGTARLDT